ncbi:MAG: hypothetical protein LBT51_01770 [Fusobacteriaceae bacterium]|jgi:hypothetical protein|nr:hypothetical protein [Fusobacteriaceae bacterium]
MITDVWGLKLKSIDGNSKFCIIMSYDKKWGGAVTLVFHKVREYEELPWITDDGQAIIN